MLLYLFYQLYVLHSLDMLLYNMYVKFQIMSHACLYVTLYMIMYQVLSTY